MEYFLAKINFRAVNKDVNFEVVHNLPKDFGLNMDCAVENWAARTNDFTDISLCNYINSKEIGYKCYTVDQFKKKYKIK
jgi:hypothetical protein